MYVPYERGDRLAALHRSGEVLSESAEPGGIRVSVRLDAATAGRFDEFATAAADGMVAPIAVAGGPPDTGA